LPTNRLERVADIVARYMVEDLELDTVFAVTGAGIMHLTDGLARENRLKVIFPHHEQTSSMAVDAYSRYSGKVGVSFYSTGPAATNAITGLAGCWQDSVATIFISGQVKRSESTEFRGMTSVRQFGVQELNILPIVKSITKHASQVQNPELILYELDRAKFAASSGRPGPVWLEIPMDVQSSLVETSKLTRFSPPAVHHDAHLSVVALQKLISESRRPVVVAGQGVRLSGSREDFLSWAERAGLPFVTPYLGVDVSPKSHPNYIGVTGVKGDRAANWAMQSSDLIIAMGTSMHVSVTGYDYQNFAPDAKKVIVNIDALAGAQGNVNYDLRVIADIHHVIKDLETLEARLPEPHKAWAERLKSVSLSYPVIESDYDASVGSNIYEVVGMVNDLLEPNDCVISDAGSAFYCVSQALALNDSSQRYITSGAMATMGFSLPAAIGAAVAGAHRVIAYTGDGSLQQTLQEISLMALHRLNIKLLVLNNDGYLSIRASQKNYFDGRLFGTDEKTGVLFPDLAKIADAYGVDYYKIDKPSDFSEGARLLSENGPLLMEIKCPPNQPIIPTVGSKLSLEGVLSSSGIGQMNPAMSDFEHDKVMRFLKGD